VAVAVKAYSPGTRRAVRVRRPAAPPRLEGLAPDPEHAWRHDNIGRLFVFAFSFFEERLLERIHGAGHREVKHIHFNLFRNVDRDGTRLVELARRVGITKAAMGQLAREGARLGLFRIGADPSDGRAKIVSFTPRGQRLHRVFREQIDLLEAEFRHLLGARRYRSLRADLLYLRERLSGPP
jgi:DNA-binding MarR family transcriptional regulator